MTTNEDPPGKWLTEHNVPIVPGIESAVLPDGCVDGHSPGLVNCELGVDWP